MKVINKVSQELWDDVASKCDYATFFHTYTWAKIITDTYDNYKIATKAFIFDDGTRVIFPLIETSSSLKGFARTYQSMIPGVYGGPLSDKEVLDDKTKSIFRSLINSRTKYISILSNPFLRFDLNGYYKAKSCFTHLLTLDKGFDTIWKSFTKGHKSSSKKAEKKGVCVRVSENLKDYEEYYSVYKDSIRRWGKRTTSHYSFKLFENIYNSQNKNIRLWLALIENEVIGGALVFYWNNHVVWWHGASIEKFFSYCPANLLQTKIIKDACERGYRYYDFNPSGGHKGVEKFKESFGAVRCELSFWYWENKGIRLINKMRNFQFATSTTH